MSHYQIVMLQNLAATILQATAFTLCNRYTDKGLNKQMFIADKMSCLHAEISSKFWVYFRFSVQCYILLQDIQI